MHLLPFTIFIVEDNAWYSELLAARLAQNPDYTVRQFATGAECLAQLAHETPDLITLDYGLPDRSGAQVLADLRQRVPAVPVIVISAQEDVSTAVSLLQQGAYDYFVKDEQTPERLWFSARKVQAQQVLRHENEQLRQQVGQKFDPAQAIIGTSARIRELLTLIDKAARTNISVSLSGETGTGKELTAKAIHYQSSRSGHAFVALNVAAIPPELVEGELFGHEASAAPGMPHRRIGALEQAQGGSLFIDEIAALEPGLQAKLLRALQERQFVRVGGTVPIILDVRLLVATEHDLSQEVQAGRFRQDLYYHLLGLPIALPPLRERGQDVILLAEAFLREFCQQNTLPPLRLADGARQKLLRYPFPGNVRELKAVVELAAVLAEGKVIQSQDLSLRESPPPASPPAEPESLREQVAAIVQRSLDAHNGNILQVAHVLKIGKSTIYRMIQNNEVRVR